ncbi:hypothetical protein Misp01_73690 [Microtetraspora sp. NBRC 13810]|uniref:DUF2784 domain-containing protein n=1 Tax=Microtetraspora sp. NBRC 13810 TaxID=3030990 RepID=UPI0024A0BD66|nr:DUF2784 domain-containing protein [Microtetraspora sp. NBRC 13810]GLW12241.1 hypothetical protein Misp01_73690 [Microtetraspora sp. NBRC 13810]
MYTLIADATMTVHFLFLGYLAVGGFLAWVLPRTIAGHLAVAAWGLVSVTVGVECPLTLLEDWARRNAGLPGLPPSGFIDHYIEGVVYPARYTGTVQLGVAVLIAVSWGGWALLRRSRRRVHVG